MPGADLSDTVNPAGYAYALTLEQVLPGSLINTSPTDYKVIETIRLQRFNGKSWDFVD